MYTSKKAIGKIIGFSIVVLLFFGPLLLLMTMIDARWFAYVLLGISILTLSLLRHTRLWRGWRILLIWALAVAIAFTGLILGRPSLQVSFSGTLQREGRRVLFHFLEQQGDYYTGVANFVRQQKRWIPPSGYNYQTVDLSASILELVNPDEENGKIIYQFHGGAYMIPLANNYRDTAVKLSESAKGAAVALLDYRVAPEYIFPAALEDAVEGWEYLLSLGYAPDDILLFGDSAGGNLALSLCQYLRDEGRELPCGIIAVSPWADLAEKGESYQYNLYNDPSFGISESEDPASAGVPTDYAGETDPHTPYLSPIYGSYEGFPPMLLTVGSWELLASDSITIHEKALASGVDAQLICAEGMFHVYPITAQSIPESKNTWTYFESFIEIYLLN